MDWTGRIDGYDEDVLRVHQVVKVRTLEELLKEDSGDRKVCFVSFNSDEGIRRNNGRTGASEGWRHLKAALSNYPIFDTSLKLYDLKEPIEVVSGDLEAAQEKLANTIAELKKKNYERKKHCEPAKRHGGNCHRLW